MTLFFCIFIVVDGTHDRNRTSDNRRSGRNDEEHKIVICADSVIQDTNTTNSVESDTIGRITGVTNENCALQPTNTVQNSPGLIQPSGIEMDSSVYGGMADVTETNENGVLQPALQPALHNGALRHTCQPALQPTLQPTNSQNTSGSIQPSGTRTSMNAAGMADATEATEDFGDENAALQPPEKRLRRSASHVARNILLDVKTKLVRKALATHTAAKRRRYMCNVGIWNTGQVTESIAVRVNTPRNVLVSVQHSAEATKHNLAQYSGGDVVSDVGGTCTESGHSAISENVPDSRNAPESGVGVNLMPDTVQGVTETNLPMIIGVAGGVDVDNVFNVASSLENAGNEIIESLNEAKEQTGTDVMQELYGGVDTNSAINENGTKSNVDNSTVCSYINNTKESAQNPIANNNTVEADSATMNSMTAQKPITYTNTIGATTSATMDATTGATTGTTTSKTINTNAIVEGIEVDSTSTVDSATVCCSDTSAKIDRKEGDYDNDNVMDSASVGDIGSIHSISSEDVAIDWQPDPQAQDERAECVSLDSNKDSNPGVPCRIMGKIHGNIEPDVSNQLEPSGSSLVEPSASEAAETTAQSGNAGKVSLEVRKQSNAQQGDQLLKTLGATQNTQNVTGPDKSENTELNKVIQDVSHTRNIDIENTTEGDNAVLDTESQSTTISTSLYSGEQCAAGQVGDIRIVSNNREVSDNTGYRNSNLDYQAVLDDIELIYEMEDGRKVMGGTLGDLVAGQLGDGRSGITPELAVNASQLGDGSAGITPELAVNASQMGDGRSGGTPELAVNARQMENDRIRLDGVVGGVGGTQGVNINTTGILTENAQMTDDSNFMSDMTQQPGQSNLPKIVDIVSGVGGNEGVNTGALLENIYNGEKPAGFGGNDAIHENQSVQNVLKIVNITGGIESSDGDDARDGGTVGTAENMSNGQKSIENQETNHDGVMSDMNSANKDVDMSGSEHAQQPVQQSTQQPAQARAQQLAQQPAQPVQQPAEQPAQVFSGDKGADFSNVMDVDDDNNSTDAIELCQNGEVNGSTSFKGSKTNTDKTGSNNAQNTVKSKSCEEPDMLMCTVSDDVIDLDMDTQTADAQDDDDSVVLEEPVPDEAESVISLSDSVDDDLMVDEQVGVKLFLKVLLVFTVYDERPMVIDSLNLKLRQIARFSLNVILDEMLSAFF